MSAPVLEAVGVAKTFRVPMTQRNTIRQHSLSLFRRRAFRDLHVLQDVNVALRAGETLGLMGRNGSGKSTLLKILSGIYTPDAGQVMRRARITPILELGIGWNQELDAIDNVYLLGTVMGMTLPEVRVAMNEILAFAEVEAFANLKLQHYSTGMASRLAYAVAFQAVREILILDEVFAVGDVGFKRRCEERYRQLVRDGHSVLLVSHEPRIISAHCTRAVLLEAGRVQLEGPAEAVSAAYTALLSNPSSGLHETPAAPVLATTHG